MGNFSQEKITKILDLFFAFNYVENSTSLMVEESTYNDEYFRWKHDSFKHDKYLTAICNDNRILLFDTMKIRDRLGANMDKIKHDGKSINFGCPFAVVRDIVLKIPIQELTDEELLEIDTRMSEMKEVAADARKRLLEKERQQQLMKEERKGYAKIPINNKTSS